MKTFQLIFVLAFFSHSIWAQDVSFAFENAAQTSEGGNTFYEVDVVASTTSPFKLGSGQLYFDYNPTAFGNSIFTNNKITITTDGMVLGTVTLFPFYNNFVTNDNTTSRVSFSWQQALGASCLLSDNITGSSAVLFHMKIEYTSGGTTFPADLCFTSVAPFDDQTFTACGPFSGACGFANCGGDSGTQIINDDFNCLVVLPVELLSFDAALNRKQEVDLTWITETEINNDYFEIERSIDGVQFETIGMVDGKGNTTDLTSYYFMDKRPIRGINYYRLKQVDFDGSFSHSDVRSVRIRTTELSLFPNPTRNQLNIDLGDFSEEVIGVEIYNIVGGLVYSGEVGVVQGISNISLTEASILATGTYTIKVSDRKQVIGNLKFVKI